MLLAFVGCVQQTVETDAALHHGDKAYDKLVQRLPAELYLPHESSQHCRRGQDRGIDARILCFVYLPV